MKQKEIVLSIEGSGSDSFSISIFKDTKLLAEDFYTQTQFSDLLIPAIEKILLKTSVSKQSIGAIFTTTGPGSFTSIRVILSSVMALSLGLKVPIYTLDSLKASALGITQQKIAVALTAYKKELYTAFFDQAAINKELPTDAKLLKPAEFLTKIKNYNYCLVGNGIAWLQKNYDFIPTRGQEIITRNYLKSSQIAKYLFCVRDKEKYRKSEPLYLKQPDFNLPSG